MTTHLRALAGALLAAALAVTPALAADAERGKQKSTTCAACHGADGNSQSPDFPRIAGQHEDYLYHTLAAYKSGKRKNPIMAGQVANLSKQDMQDLAAYFADQQGLYVRR